MDPNILQFFASEVQKDPSFLLRFQIFVQQSQQSSALTNIIETTTSSSNNNTQPQQPQSTSIMPRHNVNSTLTAHNNNDPSTSVNVIVSASQQQMDELEIIDPFLNISDDMVKKEPSERLRYFHIKGRHLQGLSAATIRNTEKNFEFKNGMIFTKRLSRKKNNRVPNVTTSLDNDSIQSIVSGKYSLDSFTKEVKELGYYIVPPIPLRKKIMELYHTVKTSHGGLNILEMVIRKKYWWKNLREDISQYLKCCETCLDRKSTPNTIDDRLINMQVYHPFESFSMDIAFVSRSREYVGYLLLVEGFTKFLWVNAIKHKDAITVQQHLNHTFNELKSLHGIDFSVYKTRCRHDLGKEFVNRAVKEVLDKYSIIDSPTNAYSPSENGLAERNNRTVKEAIEVTMRSVIENDKSGTWVDFLPEIIHKHNNTINTVTKYSPQELFNRVVPSRIPIMCDPVTKCNILIDIRIVTEEVQARFSKQKERVNRHKSKTSAFQIGQLVMVSKPPYAKAISIGIGEHRKRKGKIIEETFGHKFIVQWQATGGFLATETPFSNCKYPIEPKFLSSRVLGCDNEAVHFEEEVYELDDETPKDDSVDTTVPIEEENTSLLVGDLEGIRLEKDNSLLGSSTYQDNIIEGVGGSLIPPADPVGYVAIVPRVDHVESDVGEVEHIPVRSRMKKRREAPSKGCSPPQKR